MLLLIGFVVVAVVTTVAVRRHSLRPLLTLRLRNMWLIWVAALVQYARSGDLGPTHGIVTWHNGAAPVLATFLLATAFVAANLGPLPPRTRLMAGVFAFGCGLNALVIVINGHMPFSMVSARLAGVSADAIASPASGHGPINIGTRLPALSDVIPVPGPGVVVSVGDLLMIVGIIWVLAHLALKADISLKAADVAPAAASPGN